MPLRSDPTTWKDPRHRRGVEGEEVARAFLESRGWVVEDHRFRMGRFEIDLVVRRGRLVAFVEVKTRWGWDFGSPVEAVTWRKRREIARVAQAWVDRHGRAADTYRFDVVGVTLSRAARPSVEHVADAFRVAR